MKLSRLFRRFLWAWTRPAPPPEIAALQVRLRKARTHHQPVRAIERKIINIRHERLRRAMS